LTITAKRNKKKAKLKQNFGKAKHAWNCLLTSLQIGKNYAVFDNFFFAIKNLRHVSFIMIRKNFEIKFLRKNSNFNLHFVLLIIRDHNIFLNLGRT